ncbi:hypothetical protein [Mucilaginibacter sp. SP1R1]|uniref:hypothetical protein n=1 Tax=Mucilaginibacter sp. SP1R1 TaxID=2723091 RepID=UPI001617CE8D|nr:hypothetical protein [Mucilaginibacter sp. SP1R1]MBB6152501.1 hypothetical protein [Mucilaginibacter sp. SP1R1]
MDILHNIFKTVIVSCAFIFSTHFVNAQAKNAIGVGLGLNVSKENSQGFGGVFQGEIKLSKSVSLLPSLGVEIPYVIYLGLGSRYYFTPKVYGSIGGFAHYDGDNGGLGGSAGVGFILLSARKQVLDLNLHGDYMEKDHRNTPVAGFRLIYSFSFSKLD